MAEDRTLMPLLFALTLVSGLIDAVSFLRLGHVFVSNMTGNVVLLGLAIAGAKGISIGGSLLAIAAFMIGGVIGGRLSRNVGSSAAYRLAFTTQAKVVLMLVAALVAWRFGTVAYFGYAITALLATSMGLQNAVVRSLAIPDITTTVVTSIITGIAADSSPAGGENTRVGRRVISVILMLAGALVGALLVFTFGTAIALVAAALVVAAISAFAKRLAVP